MPKPKDLLNKSQEAFCQEFIIHFNATKAAIAAGYSEKGASSKGSQLLANVKVQARIKELQQKRQDRTQVTQDMVIKRLADIAFANLGLVATWDEHGLKLIESKDLTPEQMATIDSLSTTPISDGEGGLLGYKIQVKQKDSMKALELLCKHMGILDGSGNNAGRDSESLGTAIRGAFDALRAKRSKSSSRSDQD